MAPRKVTFNIDQVLYDDAVAMMPRLDHRTFSDLAAKAVAEYILREGVRIHSEWQASRQLDAPPENGRGV